MPLTIVRQDITKMHVDAIVNAANTRLEMGGGVCGSIFRAAGEDKLTVSCKKLSPIHTGEAVITPGFNLPAKFIIHAAGPVYSQLQAEKCEEQLKSAYMRSLILAYENGCESIAFPLISSGIFGYPKDEALRVAIDAISDFLKSHDLDVYLAIFDRTSFVISKDLLGDVQSYIDEKYVEEHTYGRSRLLDIEIDELAGADMTSVRSAPPDKLSAPQKAVQKKKLFRKKTADIDSIIDNLDEPFNTTLFKIIDAKGMTDAEVYKKANIDRKLFSKIRTGNGYMPGKRTILALAIALELSLSETDGLLERAGYALSHSQKLDVIVEYFIINKRYNIFEINEVLFKYDLPLLGAK